MEMPSLQKLHDQLKDEVFFVFVSDENSVTVQEFMSIKRLNLPVYLFEDLSSAYPTDGIPATFVISPDGDIVYKQIGVVDWGTKKTEDFLRSLLR